ncbi:hypothetical protein BDV35DRAFT_337146 [Aspergillus flavus]|uniref:Uncharacterized protein n=1 Tax=Aspergillus flavus TaxID=5059 RepID=A0A5N6HD76_ASPFL|nr:hypothetical protein BDV35DRAFT_337146 [Aspergillus flavus]
MACRGFKPHSLGKERDLRPTDYLLLLTKVLESTVSCEENDKHHPHSHIHSTYAYTRNASQHC